MRVIAIVPYHLDFCAGQRFRIELWAKELEHRGIHVEFIPFTTPELTDVLYQPKRNAKKASLIIAAFMRQLVNVFQAKRPDLIFIYREAAVAGPAIIEKIVRRWRIPIIYDIDEPLFVPYLSPSNGYFSRLKFFSKIDQLFKMSDDVFAVNSAIADYARKFNESVEIVPMAVDVERYRPLRDKKENEKPIIAWVGTRTSQPNIQLCVPAMRELGATYDFTFRIIADDVMDFEGLDVDFVPWSYDGEVQGLQEADIGITPVMDGGWSKWKFFFKTLQFMAIGMPVVASAVGSNLEIIVDGQNGFLASNEREWLEKLTALVEQPELRKRLGSNARKTVLEKFDIEKQYDFLEETFTRLTAKIKT